MGWTRQEPRRSLRPSAVTTRALALAGLVVAGLVAGRLVLVGHAATLALPLHRIATVPLPGGTTRFDYADLDPASHRLFLAHMGDGTVLEVDTDTRQVVRTIPGLPTVTGLIVVPALHRVFASAAGADQVVMLDEDTGTVLSRTPAGSFPDGLAYVPSTRQVWVSNEDGGTETVLDATTGWRVANVELGGEAGNVRYDPTADRVLVDVQTRNELVVLDPYTRRVTSRVGVPGCEHDHGLLLDAARAFVACDGNNVLLVLRLRDFTQLAVLDLGDGPDVLALDPTRHLLYVAAESGVLTTVDTMPSTGRVTGRAQLGDNAHVVAVDPTTGTAYFPLRRGPHGRPALLITTPT